MAVVFISPKKRQRTFLMGIVAIFAVFILFVALMVFFSQPKPVSSELAFNKPKVKIDFSVFDLEQFKNLESFVDMKSEFHYIATTEKDKRIEGFVSASSLDEAKQILEGMNLKISKLEEAEVGRENPFIPYYQSDLPELEVNNK